MAKFLLVAYLLLSVTVLAACSGMPSNAELRALDISPPNRQQLDDVLSGRALPGGAVQPALPEEDIFALNDDMRAFLRTHVPARATDAIKLRRLLKAIFHPQTMGLSYDPFKTYSAADTFYFQRGNCLSFTLMFVSMAREVGLDAHINEVDVPPIWDMQDEDTFVFYKHVNTLVKLKQGGQKVVDLNLEDYDINYRQRLISERLASAQFYNNRGVQLLYQHNYREAFRYLRRAIALEPRVSYLWGSLGSLYRKAGLLEQAEIAYLQALQLSHRDLVALSNLGRLYSQMGREDRAREFHRLAAGFRRTNPYYRYNKAKTALQQGDYPAALEHIRYAIRGYGREHRFYHLAAVIHHKLGNLQQVRNHLQRAARVAPEAGDSRRYRSKLDKLVAAN